MTDVKKPNLNEISNSYSQFASNIYGYGNMFPGYGTQVNQSDTLWLNNRWYLISNFRQLLSEMYTEHGIIQTLVDQPVDDGFRSGFQIYTGQLDPDDIEILEKYLEEYQVIEEIKYACKWARLYGGGAILPILEQNPSTELKIDSIKKGAKLKFKAVDMWELYHNYANIEADLTIEGQLDAEMEGEFYNYYGHDIHKSRVMRIEGKRPTSFIRPRLRGWGMSECEKIVSNFNQYLKNQNVVFELLDEAKVDVYRIDGFNTALLHQNGTNAITNRVMLANQVKNYLNALTMDTKDEYDQKQIAFTGLSDVLVQIRQGIAADLKMPITKLFGVSAAGFNSGEDDIENYNSMIESEIRAKSKFIVIKVLNFCCQSLFGFVPDDLMIEFNPLRIMSAEQEELIKNHKSNRVLATYSAGLMTSEEAKEAMNKDALLPVELDPSVEAVSPMGQDFTIEDNTQGQE